MRSARVYMHGELAGILDEIEKKRRYRFRYLDTYTGEPVSLKMPVENQVYEFDRFPPFFDGLLPEGFMLEALLRQQKIDRYDHFSQLLVVGGELVGAVNVEEVT